MTGGGPNLIEDLKQRFGDAIVAVNVEAIDPWIQVSPESWGEIAPYLRDAAAFRFDMLNCVTVVDYFEPDPKKAKKADFDPHLEVVYHLWSVPNKTSLVIKIHLPRWKDDVEGELPEVPSVAAVWPGADWHERETYDLSGVRFVGHPALRRILCPEDWVGHPLRKDYEMPLEYHGIRGK